MRDFFLFLFIFVLINTDAFDDVCFFAGIHVNAVDSVHIVYIHFCSVYEHLFFHGGIYDYS